MRRNPKFFGLLVSHKIVTKQIAEQLHRKYQGDSFVTARNLLRKGIAEKSMLGQLMGDSIGTAWVDLQSTVFQSNVVQMLNENFARKNQIILMYQFGDTITAAVSDPTDPMIVRKAERITGKPVSPLFAFPEEIEEAINTQYRSTTGLDERTSNRGWEKLIESGETITEEKLQSISGDQAVADFAREVIVLAAQQRTSDIHFEPDDELLRIRFRVDGVLQERVKLERALLPTLLSCLKLLANLDIAERRKPQDGRINLQVSSNTIDIRFSSIPTIYGEKVVLRILGENQMRDIPNLSDLNFSHANHQQLKKVINMPNGIFLVSGPTGSGKTTSLFGLLKSLNKPDVNIMTIEDPVEYRLKGVNQVQVNPAIDFNFSAALKFFLRQDPDIILVGEVRDLETARISVQAALTGHLVLATLHTNNALQVVTRLMDIGVEPYMVSAAIRGVMAQRLVRKICDQCKEKYQLPELEVNNLFHLNGNREVYFYRGKGCPNCNNTGYSGRMAIHEVFLLNDEFRRLVSNSASVLEISACAQESGFKPIYYDGLKKALRGMTTIDEINRVSLDD